MQSPVTGLYTAGDIGRAITTATGALSPNNLLSPPKGIPLTPSFEDLASIASGLVTPRLHRHDDSGSSNESFDEDEEKQLSPSEDQRLSHTKPSPDVSRKSHLDVQSRRERFQTSRHSSADITLLAREKRAEDLRSVSEMTEKKENSDLRQKRNILLKIHQDTESDPTFSTHLPSSTTRCHKRTVSGSALLQDNRIPHKESELRPRHINKATGIYCVSFTVHFKD